MDLKKKHDVKYIMGNSVAENRVRQRSDSGESADESGSNEHFLIKKQKVLLFTHLKNSFINKETVGFFPLP